MAKKKMARGLIVLGGILLGAVSLSGCGNKTSDGKTEVEMISYKPEAVAAFEKIEERFNETHDDIHLTIESPNEAVTILKTRFIREDYPDIVGIGGDMNYSNFLDAGLFEDLSDLDVLKETKQAYLDMEEELKLIPTEGSYALPYAANAAGIYFKIIYVFLTIFLYLLKCPQSLILSALRAFCFCGKPHISRSIFLYFRYQAWLKSW